MVSSRRQKAMIFSVREKASSGVARGPWRRAPKGRCNETERMGRALSRATDVPSACASRMQPREASPGKSARTGETASSGSRSCKGAHFVDFSATCLYRANVMEHAETDPPTPLGLTPRAVERVKELRTRDGLPPTRALRVAVVGGGCSGFSYQLDF